tara:strand:- start:91520 stop:92683 length:1164 start_codon:yes stop_codon:yes gene_type:complete
MSIIYAILFLAIPALLLWLSHHQQWAAKLGIIALCYIAGLLVGNAGLIPDAALPVQQLFADATVVLAMPLLLFTLDLRQWSKVAGKAMLSMVIATTSVVTLATCLFFVFRDQGAESASHFAAMSVGVYTGGTPNLAAIKAGLEIPHSAYIIFHSLDTFVGAAYLLMMLTVGIPIFRRFLGAGIKSRTSNTDTEAATHFESENFSGLLQAGNAAQILKAIVLSLLVVAAALGVSELVAGLRGTPSSSATVIIALTSFGILLSLVPGIRRISVSYTLGMYLIYVFCFVVASMASIDRLGDVNLSIAAFLLGTIMGSLLLHCLLCKLAKIDGDTFMVTSVAAVCSPPFVPMIAKALNNPGTILSGMTTGIIGYALGNYLGISLGLLLMRL